MRPAASSDWRTIELTTRRPVVRMCACRGSVRVTEQELTLGLSVVGLVFPVSVSLRFYRGAGNGKR